MFLARTRFVFLPIVAALLPVAGAEPAGASGVLELGADDFLVSEIGGVGVASYGDALSVAVAYNSLRDEYLVVWSGADSLRLAPGEFEVFGQRVSAATGAALGVDDFRISVMGPEGDPSFDSGFVDVEYNPIRDEYLVAWNGEEDTGGLVEGESEIFVQRLAYDAGGDLVEVGTDDQRISDVGGIGNASFDAFGVTLAFDSVADAFLAVWWGDDNEGGLVDEEFEIFAQQMDYGGPGGSLREIGANDLRVSDIGGIGSTGRAAYFPEVAFNAARREFLVVWGADDDAAGQAGSETEVLAQRIDAQTGLEVGPNDFRISDMGPPGDFHYGVQRPIVVWNPQLDQYMVAWTGDTNEGGLVVEEYEVFGQRLDSVGAEIGADDFPISDMNSDGVSGAGVLFKPALSLDAQGTTYWIGWMGRQVGSGEDPQAYVRRVDAVLGLPLGTQSQVGQQNFPGGTPFPPPWIALTTRLETDEAFATWIAYDDRPPLDPAGEEEVFGQRLRGALFDDGFETGSTTRWSPPM